MPELPEVETVKRELTTLMQGRTTTRIEVHTRRLRFDVPKAIQKIEGQRIDAIERRAKYLLFRIGDLTVLSHLGMTGTWTQTGFGKHDHLVWTLSDGTRLVYNDPRKFGFIDVFATKDEATHPRIRDLGPEPLSADFNAFYLKTQMKGRKAAIKALLMDQAVVVGVGNIYAQEALFRAGISPRRAAGRVKSFDALVEHIKTILNESIVLGGSSIDDYRRTTGESGDFQRTFAVYGKAKHPCPACGLPLKSARVGGRGTVYCSRCQK